MKSVNQIAREIGISPQAIYKRFKSNPELLEEIQQHVTFKGGMKFNSEGEMAVKSLFSDKIKQNFNQVVNSVESQVEVDNLVEILLDPVENLVELVDNQLLNQLHDEIAFLREQLLVSDKRNHELAMRLADLVKNNQSLIALLEENQVEQPRLGFWQRLFGKK